VAERRSMLRCSVAVLLALPCNVKVLLAHLLLCPNDIGVGVLVEMRGQEVIWQWRELLETGDGNIVNLAVFPLLEKLEVDLTRAEDMSSNLFWGDQSISVGFGNVSLESRLSDKVGNVGLDEGVSEEGFREEDDELDCQCCLDNDTQDVLVYGTLANSVVEGRGSSWQGC
jgi:hypothetical protein